MFPSRMATVYHIWLGQILGEVQGSGDEIGGVYLTSHSGAYTTTLYVTENI
jgi:hypothetical protein